MGWCHLTKIALEKLLIPYLHDDSSQNLFGSSRHFFFSVILLQTHLPKINNFKQFFHQVRCLVFNFKLHVFVTYTLKDDNLEDDCNVLPSPYARYESVVTRDQTQLLQFKRKHKMFVPLLMVYYSISIYNWRDAQNTHRYQIDWEKMTKSE